jgi:hypothetical protein
MLQNLLGGLVDKEQITYDTIQSTLEDVAEELNCSYKEFFIMIKPINEDFDMRFDIFKYEEGKPKHIREITLKQILKI